MTFSRKSISRGSPPDRHPSELMNPTVPFTLAQSPTDLVLAIGRRFPDIWQYVDEMIGKSFPSGAMQGADYCLYPHGLPMSLLDAIYDHQAQTPSALAAREVEAEAMGVAMTWRLTQGIYRFDPTLFQALSVTAPNRSLPFETLLHLPEWAVYLERPDSGWSGEKYYGVFARLSPHRDIPKLRLYALGFGSPFTLELDLDCPIEAAVENALEANPAAAGRPQIRAFLNEIIAMVLYLCSEKPDLDPDGRVPVKPGPVKTRKGLRRFPAAKPMVWDVGARLGVALKSARREYEAGAEASGAGAGTSRRPHIRRAHWHTFLSGPRTAPVRKLLWLPPIPVRFDTADEIVPVIRPVK